MNTQVSFLMVLACISCDLNKIVKLLYLYCGPVPPKREREKKKKDLFHRGKMLKESKRGLWPDSLSPEE